MRIFENDEVIEYLATHQLRTRYLKAKAFLQSDNFTSVDFKKRNPKRADIYQLRITGKYRAYCYFIGSDLYVFAIDDHQ